MLLLGALMNTRFQFIVLYCMMVGGCWSSFWDHKAGMDTTLLGINKYATEVVFGVSKASIPKDFVWNVGSGAGPCRNVPIVPCYGCSWEQLFVGRDTIWLEYYFVNDKSSAVIVPLTKSIMDSLNWMYIFYNNIDTADVTLPLKCTE